MRTGSLSRGLFTYKSPLFFNPKLGLKNSPAKAPDDKSVPPSAEGVKGLCPFETHHLLKKVGENFSFAPTQSFHYYNIFFCKEKELRRPEALSPMTLYQANASIHGPT